jgi:hypothetical protein
MPRQLGMFLRSFILSGLFKLVVASVVLVDELQAPSAAAFAGVKKAR